MSATQLHLFSEFVIERPYVPSTDLDESSCVTGDAQRMYALYEQTDDATRHAQERGEETIAQVLEVPFLELEAQKAAA